MYSLWDVLCMCVRDECGMTLCKDRGTLHAGRTNIRYFINSSNHIHNSCSSLSDSLGFIHRAVDDETNTSFFSHINWFNSCLSLVSYFSLSFFFFFLHRILNFSGPNHTDWKWKHLITTHISVFVVVVVVVARLQRRKWWFKQWKVQKGKEVEMDSQVKQALDLYLGDTYEYCTIYISMENLTCTHFLGIIHLQKLKYNKIHVVPATGLCEHVAVAHWR